MKKAILIAILFAACGNLFAGTVGLPTERIALPEIQGECQVCVWDEAAGEWMQTSEAYDHSGSYNFQLPEWDQWYWVGVMDAETGEYLFGKWVGNFVS